MKSRVVVVKFLGLLERLARRREARVEIDEEATILDLLGVLGERYGPDLASAIFRAPHEVHTHLRVFLNEEEAAVTDRVARVDNVSTTMAVLVLPIFEGGS